MALRPEREGEAGVVAPAERGLGVGGVAAEVEDGLLEGAVRVGEDEEPVEEAVRGGGTASECPSSSLAAGGLGPPQAGMREQRREVERAGERAAGFGGRAD